MQITKGIGCRGGCKTALRQLSVCRDRLSPPRAVLCSPSQRRRARWLQAPGTRLPAPSALYTAWKGANMPLSAWPAKRCGRTWKEEDVQPRIPPHTDYSSKESGSWGGGVGQGGGRRTQQNRTQKLLRPAQNSWRRRHKIERKMQNMGRDRDPTCTHTDTHTDTRTSHREARRLATTL